MIRAVAAALLLTTAVTAQEALPGAFAESRALPGLTAPGEIMTCTPDWYRSEVESFALMADG